MINDPDLLGEMPLSDMPTWQEWFEGLDADAKRQVMHVAELLPRVGPQEGPQEAAFNSEANILGYGGAAGGGKSALIALLSILAHERTVIYRFDAKQLRGLVDDLIDFVGTTEGLNRQHGVFYFGDRPNHMCEWGGIGNPGSEFVWRGRAHDFLAADEVTELSIRKLVFLRTWCRTVKKGQRTRTVFTFNPPGSVDEESEEISQGRWVIDFFAPWLDERHLNPAGPGELRYFITNEEGESEEVDSADPVEMKFKKDGKEVKFEMTPQTRSFIPANVQDNAYLMHDEQYMNTLLSLEEPFRSQMLLGDFRSGIIDHPQQILPTAWVDEAMDRWESKGKQDSMSGMGVDVARGGRANTVLSRRHKFWWDTLQRQRGTETPDGDAVAGFAIQNVKDGAPINIDANSHGASAYDSLRTAGVNVNGVIGQRRKGFKILSERLKIYNLRTWQYWVLRMILNPANGFEPQLPKDNRLRADLVAIRWKLAHGGFILAEDKVELRKRIHRSTDDGDAVTCSLFNVFDEPESHRLKPKRTRKSMIVSLEQVARENAARDHRWMSM